MMQNCEERIILLKPFAGFANIDDIAFDEGWREVKSFERKSQQNFEVIWEVDGGETIVRFIEDQYVLVNFVVVTGKKQNEVETLIRQKVKNVLEKEIWNMPEDIDPKERDLGIRMIAAIAPDTPTNQIIHIFSKAADDEVRNSALISIGRLAWPEFWTVVNDRVAKEEIKHVKDQAEALLQAYSKFVKRNRDGT